MTFRPVCSEEDLWEGEMTAHEVDGHDVLMIWPDGGQITAFQGMCPHQEIALVEGKFDGKTLTCRAHNWMFDACTGKGINPSDCELTMFPLRIENGTIFVDLDIEVRKFVHT